MMTSETPALAGYSETRLATKSGQEDAHRLMLIASPTGAGDKHDVVHAFSCQRVDIEDNVETFKNMIALECAVWISRPMKASKVATDIIEDVICGVLHKVLVDVKVCAVDDVWSGLKLNSQGTARQAVRNRSWSN